MPIQAQEKAEHVIRLKIDRSKDGFLDEDLVMLSQAMSAIRYERVTFKSEKSGDDESILIEAILPVRKVFKQLSDDKAQPAPSSSLSSSSLSSSSPSSSKEDA